MKVPNYDLYIKRIQEKITDLEAVLEAKDKVIAEQQGEKERIVKEQWTVKREAETARYQSEDFNKLQEVNAALHARSHEVQQGLRELKAKVKNLTAHLKQ